MTILFNLQRLIEAIIGTTYKVQNLLKPQKMLNINKKFTLGSKLISKMPIDIICRIFCQEKGPITHYLKCQDIKILFL